jgi:hypothetical protein
VDSAEVGVVFGVVSAVAGFTLGHFFTYFSDHRDSWLDARVSGLPRRGRESGLAAPTRRLAIQFAARAPRESGGA